MKLKLSLCEFNTLQTQTKLLDFGRKEFFCENQTWNQKHFRYFNYSLYDHSVITDVPEICAWSLICLSFGGGGGVLCIKFVFNTLSLFVMKGKKEPVSL